VIAITFALPEESADFRRLLQRRREVAPFCTGELHGRRLVVFHTGAGGKVCRQRLPQLFLNEKIEGLISAGFAGGLDEKLRAGDLFIADNFSSEPILETVRRLLPSAPFGPLVSARKIVETRPEREKLRAESGAVAVDMETETIARACAHHGLPFLSLRVISDTADAPFPLAGSILFNMGKQKTEPGRLARHLLAHPAKLPRLVSFSRRIGRARAELTRALELILQDEITKSARD
jgi:adenosylhomocysteine nucleosidase